MEEWLLKNWWQIGSLLILAAVGFKRLDYIEGRQDKHLDPENPAPHLKCPVHTKQFEEMVVTLDKIDKRLEKMDSRIYGFMKSNGFHEVEE